MSTETFRLSPTSTAIAQRMDFPTWLPAMLVRELRQGLRARGFVGTLVGFQMIMTLFTAFAIAGGTGSASFNILQSAYWVMLSVQLLIVTPTRALMGLQAELESNSVDLLLLTRLTAWRIVAGKWISLLVQAALLVMAMLPYGVARYFFGSVDLVSESRMIGMMFAGSAVLTAGALWASALPKIARAGFGIAIIFAWQFVPGSITSLFSLGVRGGRPMGFVPSGPAFAQILFNGALIMTLCLLGAVRRLAPRAENQAPWMRLLPLIALFPAPFASLRVAMAQTAVAALMMAFISFLELARDEEPMASHWRTWARHGLIGRVIGRLVLPGWASALEWVLVVAAAAILGGLASREPVRVYQIVMLATAGIVFPALLLTWMSKKFTQRMAGYALVLGGASLIAAVGAASASMFRTNNLADLTLQLLPIASFWASAFDRTGTPQNVLVAQTGIAFAVIAAAWWRARGYRHQIRQFEARRRAAVVRT